MLLIGLWLLLMALLLPFMFTDEELWWKAVKYITMFCIITEIVLRIIK